MSKQALYLASSGTYSDYEVVAQEIGYKFRREAARPLVDPRGENKKGDIR